MDALTIHSSTFHHTIHFIFPKKKKTYQIIHFLDHIIYNLNKKIITKQNFSLFNTTFSFSHTNHYFFNPQTVYCYSLLENVMGFTKHPHS
jgi:hypothetical protein